MVRTQIDLTEREREGLTDLAKRSGKKQNELVRQAVDRLIEEYTRERRKAALARVAGMWKDRDDLPDFEAMRKESDRF
jgi:metal-responsive CopG/Arc/MetJ family transcriptional regulator